MRSRISSRRGGRGIDEAMTRARPFLSDPEARSASPTTSRLENAHWAVEWGHDMGEIDRATFDALLPDGPVWQGDILSRPRLALCACLALELGGQLRQGVGGVVGKPARDQVSFSFVKRGYQFRSGALTILPSGQRIADGIFSSPIATAGNGLADERFLFDRELNFHAPTLGPGDGTVKWNCSGMQWQRTAHMDGANLHQPARRLTSPAA